MEATDGIQIESPSPHELQRELSPLERRQDVWRSWLEEEFEKRDQGNITEDALKNQLAEKFRQLDDELTKQIQISQVRAENLNTDELSEIANKNAFENDIDELVSNGQKFGLLMMDLDNFKNFNTLYGHMGADQAIKHVAKTIEKVLRAKDDEVGDESKRAHDTVYRLHGDEIAILVRNVEAEDQLLEVSERVRMEVVNNPATIKSASEPVPVSISVGGAIHRGENTDDFIDMVDKKALYGAKDNGKNTSYILGIHDQELPVAA